MSHQKVATKQEKVVVNRDFLIGVPEGYTYSTDKRDINENRLFVFVKEEKNDYFKEKFGNFPEFSLADPFGAPQCFTVMVGRELGNVDLQDSDVRETLQRLANQVLTMFGGECTTVKESDDILVYYSKTEYPNTSYVIITSNMLYNGQIWINDIEDNDEKDILIQSWLNQVENYVVTDADKIQRKPFKVPTYAEGKREQIGSITVGVPDHTKSLLSSADERDSLGDLMDLSHMLDEFAFLAIDKECEGGFHDYHDAAISILAKNEGIQDIPALAAYWTDAMKSERKKTIVSMVKNNFADSPYSIHYKEFDDNIAAVYTQARESTDNIEQWASYFALFVHNATVIQVNIHINALLDKSAMDNAIEEWVKTVKVASFDEIQKFTRRKVARELGKYASEDGKIDAVKTSLLFSKDVVFHNDEDMVFENGHHITKMLQFNSAVLDEYEQVKKHTQVFGTQMIEVLSYVEENKNLVIPKKLCHKNIFAATNKKQITGMSIFYLCAWHAITIGDNGNDVYMVIADSNLIKGVPEFYNLMAEFVKTLREFNGKTGDFKLMISSALVVDSPIEYIENPVLGAQQAELGFIIDVKADEHPYAGVCSKIEELKKREKAAKKSLATDTEKKEWEIKILPDATVGIYSYNGSDTVVTVPDEIDGLKVTAICENAFSPWQDGVSKETENRRKSIEKINLPNTIVSIEGCAFSNCTGLKEIILPDSVAHVKSGAFSNCECLEKIVFPVSECEVEDGALCGCTRIKDIIIINNGTVLYRYPELLQTKEYVVPEGITKIASKAFASAKIETLVIPETVSSIGSNAFSGSNIKQIIMPDTEITVEVDTFSDAKKLTDMICSKNGNILYFCPNGFPQSKVIVPDTVTKVAPGAFFENEKISDVFLSENVTEIGYGAFNTWKDECKIKIHAPKNSYVEYYLKNENEENLVFVANGEAKTPYEPEDSGGDFDLSSLLGLFGLNG